MVGLDAVLQGPTKSSEAKAMPILPVLAFVAGVAARARANIYKAIADIVDKSEAYPN